MSFFFEPFPKVNYDIKKNDKIESVTNIMLRFKIVDELKKQQSNYFDITVNDGDRPDVVASKVYDNPELDWLILMINDVIDPIYDWPMGSRVLEEFIRSKYGSIPIPKRTLVVDETTYNSLGINERESVDKYQYEIELNDDKRRIKIVDPQQVSRLLNRIEDIF